ncbi:transcription factor bHLH110-like [Bidens hawaiensis]|uniref:transcription factor bHLH110-like n=1 Tax=Bidens hawaiensis TaxID=980011 RepID=UPI004049DEE3
MESANFHLRHQQQDHQLIVDSSSFPWSQNPILNRQNNNINSRNLDTFPCNNMGYPVDNFMTHDLQNLARIKDEFSVVESYPKFLELLNCNPNYSSLLKDDEHQQISYSNNNNIQDFLLANYATGCQIKGGQLIDDQTCSNGTFSQIFPTISISSLNQSTTTSSSSSSTSSFDMNCLPALEYPFGSPRFDAKFSHHSSLSAHNLGGVSYGFDCMRQPNQRPSVYPSKVSSVSTTGSTDQSAKRPASKYVDAKETKSVAPKKSKSETRSSTAPFQVRKEKLGDRIAAIQQLVAPFGKTDTASVLMEAIGYIKFLQTQVETLSVPYMKSSNEIGGISTHGGQMEDGNPRVKRDLRSRGLCLVPVSCLSYVTDGCEGIWPAP